MALAVVQVVASVAAVALVTELGTVATPRGSRSERAKIHEFCWTLLVPGTAYACRPCMRYLSTELT